MGSSQRRCSMNRGCLGSQSKQRAPAPLVVLGVCFHWCWKCVFPFRSKVEVRVAHNDAPGRT